MKTFNVTLSRIDNPDKLKFITVEECVDMDDCIHHIHSTEKEFIIDAIREVQKLKPLKCSRYMITTSKMTFTSPDTGKVYDIIVSTSKRGFSESLTTTFTISKN